LSGKKKKLTPAQTAYCRVNLVSAEDVELPEHAAIISSALDRLWHYDGLYPNETEDLQIKRLELETPAAREVTELAEHFRELDDTLTGLSRWDVIFTMFNRLENLSKVEKSSEEKNINKEKENFKMANSAEQVLMDAKEEALRMEDDVKSIFNGAPIGKSVKKTDTGAEPEAVSNEARKAAEKFIDEQAAARIHQSTGSQVTKVVFSSPNLKARAVDGLEAYGYVKDPKEAMEAFLKKTGGIVANGTITFTNIISGQEDAAREVYEALINAKADPEYRLKARVTDGTPSIKGGYLQKAGEVAPEIVSNLELRTFLLYEAMAEVKTAADTVVKVKSISKDKETGTPLKKTAVDKKDPAKGIYSLQWSGRKKLAEDKNIIVYHKEMTTTNKPLPGFKSDICVKYVLKKNTDAETGNVVPVPGTYRISLIVDQYELKVNNDLVAKFGDGSSKIGVVEAATDFTDPEALAKVKTDLSDIFAVVAESDATGEMIDEIRATMAGLKEKADKDAAASFEDTDIE